MRGYEIAFQWVTTIVLNPREKTYSPAMPDELRSPDLRNGGVNAGSYRTVGVMTRSGGIRGHTNRERLAEVSSIGNGYPAPDLDGLPAASDSEIICALQNRNEAALASLFVRYGPMVLGIAKRILGDLPLAEDVTQDVFLSVWKHPEKFDNRRGSVRGLLAVKSHGKSVDLVRSRSARAARESKLSFTTAGESPDVDCDLMLEQTNRRLHNALLQLSGLERNAITLAFFGSQTYKQVAVSLGIPEGTAKTTIRSGLSRLHSLLSLDETG